MVVFCACCTNSGCFAVREFVYYSVLRSVRDSVILEAQQNKTSDTSRSASAVDTMGRDRRKAGQLATIAPRAGRKI